MANDIHEQLTKYLTDAHSIEEQALAQLRTAKIAGDPELARAFEHLEIGGYEQLRRVADRAGDGETAMVAAQILAQEREASERIAKVFGKAVEASLEAQGVPR
jgi:ferritin-like metal-binding protein YciE